MGIEDLDYTLSLVGMAQAYPAMKKLREEMNSFKKIIPIDTGKDNDTLNFYNILTDELFSCIEKNYEQINVSYQFGIDAVKKYDLSNSRSEELEDTKNNFRSLVYEIGAESIHKIYKFQSENSESKTDAKDTHLFRIKRLNNLIDSKKIIAYHDNH
jgi:hypothetical protein